LERGYEEKIRDLKGQQQVFKEKISGIEDRNVTENRLECKEFSWNL